MIDELEDQLEKEDSRAWDSPVKYNVILYFKSVKVQQWSSWWKVAV